MVKHVSKNISRDEVLPGRKYAYPPSQDKTNPLNVEAEHVEQVLQYWMIRRVRLNCL